MKKIVTVFFLFGFVAVVPLGVHAGESFSVAHDGRVLSATECPQVRYKRTQSFTDGLLRIPETWSYYVAGEKPLATDWDDMLNGVFLSVGQDGVAFGDTNWTQVDFIKMSGSDVQKLLDATRKSVLEANDGGFAGGGSWSVERVAGRKADVLTYDTDNGRITKGATGGKVYFLHSAEKYYSPYRGLHTYDVGLIINKQAIGDAEFECGFTGMLRSLRMSKYVDRYFFAYPVLN